MKTLFSVIVLLLISVFTSKAIAQNWQNVPGSLKYVSTVDSTTAWGVNVDDNIYRTKDGGATWQHVPGALKQVSALSYDRAWGVNSGDAIWRTQDGGVNWEQRPGALKYVSAVSYDVAWGANAADVIYRTSDAGAVWRHVPGALKQVSALSYDSAWGVNSGDAIWRTNNGGANWEQQPGALKYVSAISYDTAWGANAADVIYRTSNAGAEWEHVPGALKQVSALSYDSAWGVNSGDAIWRANYGGSSPSSPRPPTVLDATPQNPEQPTGEATMSAFGPNLTGKTVKMVNFGSGALVQTASDRWVEVAANETTPAFRYNLKQRAEGWIVLYDVQRDARLFLALSSPQVWYQQGNDTPRVIHNISSVSNVSRVPWSDQLFDKSQQSRNQPSFIVDDEVYSNEVLLSGNTVEVTVALHVDETTDWGEDEVFWQLTSPTGAVYRSPRSGWQDMNEDDSQMENWTSSVTAEIDTADPDKSFTLSVYEDDDGANNDDVLFQETLAPVVDSTSGQLSLSFSKRSTDNDSDYTASVSIVDHRIPQPQTITPQAFEKSPTVPDVIALLNEISGSASSVVETDIVGLEARWGEFVENGDHLQGIAMTTGGQLAVNISLSGEPGVFAYSDPVYGAESGDGLRWKYLQEDGGVDLWNAHPSGMASTGQIVAVANLSNGVRFIYLPSNFGDAVHLDYLRDGLADLDASAIAIAYHEADDRFFVTWGAAGVTPSDSDALQNITIYGSQPGLSLLDNTNRFVEVATVANVPVSGQGISFLVEDGGDIFLASNFNSDEEPPTAEYAPACTTEYLAASAAVPLVGPWLFVAQASAVAAAADRFPFTDILTASKIGEVVNGNVQFLPDAEVMIDKKELGRTQWEQVCVLHRPSWRWGGTIVATGSDELTAIWGGRWNTVTDGVFLSDAFEYAIQRTR